MYIPNLPSTLNCNYCPKLIYAPNAERRLQSNIESNYQKYRKKMCAHMSNIIKDDISFLNKY